MNAVRALSCFSTLAPPGKREKVRRSGNLCEEVRTPRPRSGRFSVSRQNARHGVLILCRVSRSWVGVSRLPLPCQPPRLPVLEIPSKQKRGGGVGSVRSRGARNWTNAAPFLISLFQISMISDLGRGFLWCPLPNLVHLLPNLVHLLPNLVHLLPNLVHQGRFSAALSSRKLKPDAVQESPLPDQWK